jgi:hypothetical protein
VGFLERCTKLGVRDVREAPPRRYVRAPKRLGFPQVADPGDEALVEQHVADLALRVLRAQASQHRVEVGRLAEDVRPETSRDAAVELEHGAVEHRAHVLLSA